MPHSRKRHLTNLIQKTLKFSPITGIFGHRQVGKTTLSELLADRYITLDNPNDHALAQSNALAFLSQFQAKPLVIDECQMAPALFPVMKEWVRTRKSPGQFLLTGSVRFSSRKAIQESLTGRIIAWELLPMDWSELYDQPLPDALIRASKNLKTTLKLNTKFSHKNYQKSIQTGGLPGIFSIRDPSIQAQYFETGINTILERDLKFLLQSTLPFSSLKKLLIALSRQAGHSLNYSLLQRETRISLPTLRKLIACFESLFLIRLIQSKGDYTTPVVFFEDVGELNYLLGTNQDRSLLFSSFLFQNLRTQLHYRSEIHSHVFCYRTKKGNHIPLCFEIDHNRIGILPASADLDFDLQTADSFLKSYPNSKVLIVELEKQIDQMITERIRRVHVSQLI